MRNVWIVIGAVVIVAVGASVFYVMTREGEPVASEVQTGGQADPGATKSSCDVFTLDIAKQVLGEGAKQSDLPPGANASTEDISVTQCMYETEASGDLVIANMLVRGAKNSDAYETNRFGFNDTRDDAVGLDRSEAAQSETISSLGDEAYYNPSFEQVNVLVNDGQYWVIIGVDGGTREMAEQLARAVVEKL